MNRRLYIIILLAAVTFSCVDAQTIGDAFYIYRNDGQFNAFFRDEVDSIVYSHYDADSLIYDEVVTQLVYTVDSVYRIPLAAIDSVGFVQPVTKYKEDAVPLIGNLFDHLISSDSLSLTFALSTPSGLLPIIGDKLVATDLSDKLPIGFTGTVRQVEKTADGYVVSCDSLALEEVVEQFYGVVEIVGQQGDGNVQHYLRRRGNSEQTHPFRLVIPPINQYIDLSPIVKPKNVYDINGKAVGNIAINPVISGKITRIIDNRLNISHYNIHAVTDVTTVTTVELAGEAANSDNPLNLSSPKTNFCIEGTKIGPYGIPIYYAFGPKFDISGEIALGTTVYADFTHTEDINYYPLTAAIGVVNPVLYPLANQFNTVQGTTKMTHFDIDWAYIAGRISARVAVCGRLGIGIAGKGHNLGWVGGEAQTGFKVDAELGFDFEALSNAEKGTGFYDGVKDNAKVVAQPYWGLEGKMSVLDDRYSFTFVGSNDYSFWGKKWEWDLLPKFSDTKATIISSSSAEVSANITNDCILPISVGFSLFDENGNRVGEPQWNDQKFRTRESFTLPYQTTFSDLTINKEYKAYPTLRLLGFNVLASPSSELRAELIPITMDVYNIEETSAKVYGRIDGYELMGANVKYGIGYTTEGESGQTLYDAMDDYGGGVFSVNLMALKPNTTYNYFAYLIINEEVLYGEVRSFTTIGGGEVNGNEEAYAVLNKDDRTLYFYYDGRRKEFNDYNKYKVIFPLPTNACVENCVVTASFDSSFANYLPTKISRWFYQCDKLEKIEQLFNLNTSNVTDMSRMFWNCRSLKSLNVSNFNTSKVTNMSYMFSGCESLIDLNLSNFNTSNVTNMCGMFQGCFSLTNLDVSNFNTSNVIDMDGMFLSLYSLTCIDVSNFNTAKVTIMHSMFSGCRSLTNLDVSNFNTSNVTDMEGMFYDCRSLTSLDVSNFNTSKVTNMRVMFTCCYSLISLNVSNFNTSNVTNMCCMFQKCTSLTSLSISNFNTSKVTDMSSMFGECKSLTTLDVSKFNTANVWNMRSMFSYCSSLTSLDLSNFDTSNVTNIYDMFYSCKSLITIYGSNWDVQNNSIMFEGCDNLVGGQGTIIGTNYYRDSNGNLLYYNCPENGSAAHIDGGKDWPGLFTAK